jgi:hypothetical protein
MMCTWHKFNFFRRRELYITRLERRQERIEGPFSILAVGIKVIFHQQ